MSCTIHTYIRRGWTSRSIWTLDEKCGGLFNHEEEKHYMEKRGFTIEST